MLTPEERAEMESLKKDPYVKLATKSLQRATDPEKKKLYQYRWLRNKGKRIAEEIEAELLEDEDSED